MKYALIVILSISPLAAAVNYTYDAAGRLTGVDYGNGTTIAYTYDNNGNLLSRTVTATASQPRKEKPTHDTFDTSDPIRGGGAHSRTRPAGALPDLRVIHGFASTCLK